MVGLLVVAAVAAACGGGSEAGTEPPPVGTRSPTATGAGSDEPDATEAGVEASDAAIETDAPAESAEPTTDAGSPEPGTDDPFLGQVVNTLVARLRLRAEPGTQSALAATLPLGTALYVLDGPRDASGYTWYLVTGMGGSDDTSGWVAAAGTDGEPWIGTAEADCPEAPATFEEIRGLSAGVRLACFGGTPITVTARLTTCNCDVDGPELAPEWFNFTMAEGAPVLLADPVGAGSVDVTEGLLLYVDPEGDVEDPLPLDAVVDVTGVFDHPAAQTCTQSIDAGAPEPSVACRFAFAVTSLHTAP